MRNFSLANTKWAQPGHELDALARNCLDAAVSFRLLGNPYARQRFYAEFGSELALINDDGTSNITPKKDTKHILCCHDRAEYDKLRDELTAKGLEENRDFFQGELVAPIIHLYRHGKLVIDRIEIFLTSRCTLNCAKCIAYIPHFRRRYDLPLNLLKRDADMMFDVQDGMPRHIDRIRKLKLLGGEGLLYPHLEQYIAYIRENYPDNVDEIRIGTNGTIIPSPKMLECARYYDVIFDISDYGPAVRNKCHLHQISDLLTAHNIRFDIKRTGESWLDTGIPANPLNLEDEADIAAHFHRCAMFCRDFHDGRLYFCCSNFAAVQAGLFADDPANYLDFRSGVSKKTILEYEMGFCQKGYTTFCALCRGCSMEANPLSVPVALQAGDHHA